MQTSLCILKSLRISQARQVKRKGWFRYCLLQATVQQILLYLLSTQSIAVLTPHCFIQVLKWYLSSFSASRKGNNAKKPYNPILGEVFQCWWPLPTPPGVTTPDRAGPIPWCSAKDMVFQAEQVLLCNLWHVRKYILTAGVPPPPYLCLLC